MAQVNIVYRHSAEPVPPADAEIRRSSIAEMENYMESLVIDMKIAGVSTKFESVSGDGPNDIIVNGKSVHQILDGLEIRRPEIYDDSPKVIQFERAPEDWHIECIEDISDILMKNALSKAFADSEGLRVKEFMTQSD